MGEGKRFYRWQAAFVAYCNGVPDYELAPVFDIPLATLRQRMSEEGWSGLRTKMPLVTTEAGQAMMQGGAPGVPARIESKLKLVEENRTENLKAFQKLREHAVEMISALAERRLKLKKQFFSAKACVVVEKEVEPGPGDWVNISTYLRTIAEGTYRALGDFQAQEKPGSDAPAGATGPQAPAITIILPGAIAMPRQERTVSEAKQGQVIDLRPLTEEPNGPA